MFDRRESRVHLATSATIVLLLGVVKGADLFINSEATHSFQKITRYETWRRLLR